MDLTIWALAACVIILAFWVSRVERLVKLIAASHVAQSLLMLEMADRLEDRDDE